MVVEKFIKAIHLKPGFAKPYDNIDVVYFVQNGYPTVLQNYKKAITIDSINIKSLRRFSAACKKMG